MTQSSLAVLTNFLKLVLMHDVYGDNEDEVNKTIELLNIKYRKACTPN